MEIVHNLTAWKVYIEAGKQIKAFKKTASENSSVTPQTKFVEAVPPVDARSCPRCWCSAASSLCSDSSHGQESSYRPLKLKRNLGISLDHSRVCSLRELSNKQSADIFLYFADAEILALLLSPPPKLEVLFFDTRTFCVATRRKTSTFCRHVRETRLPI